MIYQRQSPAPARAEASPPSWQERPATVHDVMDRAQSLQPVMARRALAAMGDADTDETMDWLADAGLQAINVPRTLGGLTSGQWDEWPETLKVWMALAAGDGVIGKAWGFGSVLTRTLLWEDKLPESTRAQLAAEILDEGRRLAMVPFAASGRVLARATRGGLLVNGTATLATGTYRSGPDICVVCCRVTSRNGDEAGARPARVLVRMDSRGVGVHQDGPGTGLRGTERRTIQFRDLMVPDGWHHLATASVTYKVAAITGQATLLQGIGEGALSSALGFFRRADRATMPMPGRVSTEPGIHRRIGQLAAELAAPRALILEAARQLASPLKGASPAALTTRALQADLVAARTAVAVTAELFDLVGGRSTAGIHGLDRFWREARTLSVHHLRDATSADLGYSLLNNTAPQLDHTLF